MMPMIWATSHWMSCLERIKSPIKESLSIKTKIIIIIEALKTENKRYRKILMTKTTVWTKIKKRKMMNSI